MRKNWVGKEVRVIWLDITADVHTTDAIQPEVSTTLGYVEYQDKTFIRILTTRYTVLDIADKIAIPIGCIQRIKEL